MRSPWNMWAAWGAVGCYGSLVTSSHGRSADGNGGYGQPDATAGLRTHI